MNNPQEFFDRVAALTRAGRPFAVATVVARRPPVSAHLGDRAIVFGDGRMEGFVGGACSREIIRRQALDVLQTRASRLVCIRPDSADTMESSADRIVVPMTCASEGAVDVYVEPIVRPRTLVVAGATPVADSLARLARAMRYDVVRVVDPAERTDLEDEARLVGARVVGLEVLPATLQEALADGGDCAMVVASQGHYDDGAVEAGLAAGVPYVGLVASRKRGDTVREAVSASGAPHLERLRYPAGLDLGGRGPEEVALSIIAEIIRLGAATAPGPRTGRSLPLIATPSAAAAPGSETPTAVDPVCHMDVAIAGAAHTAEFEGTTYYFCCGGCRRRFLEDPPRYLTPTP